MIPYLAEKGGHLDSIMCAKAADFSTTFEDVPRHVRASFYDRGGKENKAVIMRVVKRVRDFLISNEFEAFQILRFDIKEVHLPHLTVDARVYRLFEKSAYCVRLSLGTKPYGQFDTIYKNTKMQLFDGSINKPLSDDMLIVNDSNIKLAALFMHTYDPSAFSSVYPNVARQWS